MTLSTISNMTDTNSMMVTKDMNSWINEFNNAAKLICSTYRDDTLGVGYKVRSSVMEGLCTKLEGVLNDLTSTSYTFVVYWEQEVENDIYLEIELRH